MAAFGNRRPRPWVIGVTLVVCGFATHAAFELWVADYAGRIEMGRFAIFEGLMFLAGLGTVLVSLVASRLPGVGPVARGVAWLLWLATAFVTGLAVLIRLPP